jgi:acyl-homoserine-lactone acylase
VTYSQSSDPSNPHYADMTALYANYGWVTLPFTKDEIQRDTQRTALRLKETVTTGQRAGR